MNVTSRRWLVRAGVVALALSLLAAGCSSGRKHPSASSATTIAGAGSATGVFFSASGNQIIAPDGRPFAPEGVVLYCLAERDLSCLNRSAANPHTDADKIQASATFWHANTVRLQVAQEHLLDRSPYDSSYLAEMDSTVHLANSLGLAVILSLQEEQFSGPPMPTADDQRFWTVVAAHYRNATGVIFDLFNEPRLQPLQGPSWLWNIWQNGGNVQTQGHNYNFVGMQAMLDAVRRTGAKNLAVAEGLGSDHDLSQVQSHLLSGVNVAYGIDPDMKSDRHSPAQWDRIYGNLANQVPLVMDEFHDYPTAGACYPQSPRVLPQELSYLASKHLGLLAWTLEPGNLIVDNNLEQPTSYAGATEQLCVAHISKTHTAAPNTAYDPMTNTVGPGEDILQFFQRTARRLAPSLLLGGR